MGRHAAVAREDAGIETPWFTVARAASVFYNDWHCQRPEARVFARMSPVLGDLRPRLFIGLILLLGAVLMSTPPATNDPWAPDSSTELPKPATGRRRWALLGFAIVLDLVAFGVLGLAYYKIFMQNADGAGDGDSAAARPSGAIVPGGAVARIDMREPDFFIAKSKRDDLPTGAKVYSSINEALGSCGAGAIVRIFDQEVYEEQILHGRRSGSNSSVHIKIIAEKGPDGKTATLRLPKDAARGSPLVHLEAAEGFSIIGLTLDGDGRSDDLVLLSGNCPGATLDDCRLQGFKHAAIRLAKCEGKDDEYGHEVPIHVRGLRFDCPAGGQRGEAAPIVFQGDNQDVLVHRCGFLGPWPTPVQVEGSLRNVQFDHNLFCGEQKAAITFGSEPGSSPALEARFTNNTFSGCDYAVSFAQPPETGSAVQFNNNIFYQLGHGVGVAEGHGTIEQLRDMLVGAGNVRNPNSKGPWQQLAKLKCQEMPFELPTQPNTDPRWLRYPLNSPLTRSGQDGSYVGALTPVVE
jgi:hypothetical protein